MTPPLASAVWIARAVLARVLEGEAVRLDRIPASILPTELGLVWSAASDALDEGASPEAVLERVLRSGVTPAFVGTLIGDPHRELIATATAGLDQLAEICALREAVRAAEALPAVIATGDGVEAARKALALAEAAHVGSNRPRAADLSDWRTARPATFYVGGVVQPGAVTMLSARGGVGKSLVTLALWVRLAAGTGGLWLGAFPLTPRPLRVLLIEAECGEARTERRLRELVMGGELQPQDVDAALDGLVPYTAEGLRDRGRLLERLPELARDADADVIVLDPLRCVLPTDLESENDNVAVGAILDDLVGMALRDERAIVVIDHDSKQNGALRGASSKGDAAGYVAHLTAPDESDESYRELRMAKQRDPGGERLAAFEVRSRADESGLFPVSFVPVEPRQLVTVGGGRRASGAAPNNDATILLAVKKLYEETGHGVSVRAVVEETGVKHTTVTIALRRLVEAGLLHRPEPRGPAYPPSARPE